MIQVHGKTILSMEFKSMIKAHDLNLWQFFWIHGNLFIQNPIFIGNIKTQFSLTKLKPNSHWQYQKPNLRWHYLKFNFHWQHQNPILISNIKNSINGDTIKSLTWLLGTILSKAQSYQYLANYYIIISSPKSPIMNNTLSF